MASLRTLLRDAAVDDRRQQSQHSCEQYYCQDAVEPIPFSAHIVWSGRLGGRAARFNGRGGEEAFVDAEYDGSKDGFLSADGIYSDLSSGAQEHGDVVVAHAGHE